MTPREVRELTLATTTSRFDAPGGFARWSARVSAGSVSSWYARAVIGSIERLN